MSNISFGNLTSNNTHTSPELKKRIDSQENFTAIDKEKIKQDTVELANKAGEKAKENVKDNFVFRILRNLGVEDPKKFLKSVGLTALTIGGFALLGNKTSKYTAQFGTVVDEFLQNGKGKWIGKIGKKISNGFKKITEPITNIKLVSEISGVLSKKEVKAQQAMAKAQCSGITYQFACAVIESMQGIFYGRQKNIAKNFTKNSASNLLKITKNGKEHNVAFQKAFEIIKTLSTSGKKTDDIIELAKKPAEELARMVASGEINESLAKCLKEFDFNESFIRQVMKNAGNEKGILKKMIGKIDLDDIYSQVVNDSANDRVEFAEKLTKNIRTAQGIGDDNKKLVEFLRKVEDGKVDSELRDILMCHGMDSWGLTNWIDKLGHKIRGDKWKNLSRANLGSALIKFNSVNGDLATTAAGKFVQAAPTIVTESISNYVCDAATINAIVIPSFISLFNSVQEAPKEQKAATLASSFASDIGSLTVVMPTAGAITYGIANLSKLNGKGILKTPLRAIGKVFALGLDKTANQAAKSMKWFSKDFFKKLGNSAVRWGGGAFRLVMIMFVFSSMINKPIEKLVQKVFGKPYNKEEAEKAKQLEEQKKQVIPELGITQGELMEKMEKNPQAMQKLQTDEKLMYTVAQNPKAILDLLDNKEVQYIEPPKSPASQGKILSPANQNRISGNSTNAVSKKPDTKTSNSIKKETTQVDSATYIPSSAFTASDTTLSPEQKSHLDAVMARADKALAAAEKYI